jgi:hypothetical protein
VSKTQTKNTPGPWTFARHWTFDGYLVQSQPKSANDLPGIALVTDCPMTGAKRVGNATLIAAAPTMLEALMIAEVRLASIDPDGDALAIVSKAIVQAGGDYEPV